MSPRWSIGGVATIAGTVAGSASAPKVEGNVTSARLVVGGAVLERAQADLRVEGTLVSVPRASARALGGALEGAAVIDLARPESTRVAAQRRDVALAAIEPLIGVRLGVAAPIRRSSIGGERPAIIGRLPPRPRAAGARPRSRPCA